eukprot:547856_1
MSTTTREPIYNSLSLSIPTITILTTIIVHTLFSYFKQSKKFNKSLTFAALLSMTTFLAFAFILLYLSIREMTHTLTPSDCILYFLKDLLLIVGKIFMYLFFIDRLFYVFRGSLFKFERKQIVRYISITFILLFTPALLALTAIILPIHSIIHKQYDIQTKYDCSDIFANYLSSSTKIMFFSGIATFTLFDIIISIIILRSFISRLLWLYTWCARDTNQDMENNTFLLQTAMKSFNLTAAAITTSWFGIVFNASGYGSHWLCIDIVVNVLAMYLSFSFASNIYHKLSVCCCTNYCFIGWRKLCWCCCLKYKIPKNIQMKKRENKQQVPDVSVVVSIDLTKSKQISDESHNETNKIEATSISHGENVLNNGMKVILHDYDKNDIKVGKQCKPSLVDRLSNLSNNIKNKIQNKRINNAEKLISDICTPTVSGLSLQHAHSEPVPNAKQTVILLQNHFSNKIM